MPGNGGNPPTPPNSTLSISGIHPTTGAYNTAVTISGTGFGSTIANDSVYINGVAAVINSVNDSQLVAIVQKYTGTGDVVVKVSGVAKTGPLFTYNYTVLEFPYAGLQNPDIFIGSYKDGPAASAGFSYPTGLALDQNNVLYVNDFGNGKIRAITPPSNNGGSQVSTFYDLGNGGTFQSLGFPLPGLAFNGASFFAGGSGKRAPGYPAGSPIVELIPPPNKGVGGETQFPQSNWAPGQAFMDKAGNIYATSFNNIVIIYNVGPLSWTFIGSDQYGDQDGTWVLGQENQPIPTSEPTFHAPYGIVVDSSGNIFFTDYGNNKVRKITPAGVVTTFAGSGINMDQDGTGAAASFSSPTFMSIDGAGNFYLIDNLTTLRKITPAGVVSTLCAQCVYENQGGIVIDPAGQNLYATEYQGGTIDIYHIY